MILTIDTHKPLSIADTAILRALLGQVEPPAEPTPAPKPETAWDPKPAAEAFIGGFMTYLEATIDARMSCAVEACRGLLPGPLSLTDREARKLAADTWFKYDEVEPERQAIQTVLVLASHCS